MEFKETQAIYVQIADYIYENILLNKWKEGDRIPSVRELAVNIEVNPNTVMRAYTYLQDQNIIYNKRGIGYFIADNAKKTVKDIKVRHLYEQELPKLMKLLKLLGLSWEDLTQKIVKKAG